MSTKTSFKRVALVAVAGLVSGLVSVAPASAATSAASITNATQYKLVGTASTAMVIGATPSVAASQTITATLVVPAGSAVTMADRDGSFSTATTAAGTAAADGTNITVSTKALTSTYVDTYTVTGGVAAAGTASSYVIIPDVPGYYSLTIHAEGGADAVGRIFSSGLNATIGVSGTGTTAVTGILGGQVQFKYTTVASTATAADKYIIKATGATIVSGASLLSTGAAPGTNTAIPSNGSTADYSAGVQFTQTTSSVSEQAIVTLTSAGVAAGTISVTKIDGTTGAPTEVATGTIAWGATASTSVSAANSTVYIRAGVAAPDSANDATAVTADKAAQTAAANAAANIKVVPLDGNANAVAAQKITATIAGPGMLSISAAQAGATATGRAVTGTAGDYFINVYGDGTAGVATITISVGTTVLATKTVTFTGAATKYTVTNNYGTYKVGTNGTDATAGTAASLAAGTITPSTLAGIKVLVTDANGNKVKDGTVVIAKSATTSVATVSAATTTTSGYAYFRVTGVAAGSSVISFYDAATAADVTVTASTTVNVTSEVASSVKLSFDKASYVPGEKVVLTLTATNAAGKGVADLTDGTNLLAADIASSVQFGGDSLTGSNDVIFTSNGTATWTLYAPLSSGNFQVTAKTGASAALATAAQAVAISATATVTGGTLETLVNSLIKKINALSTLVAKIQKKLGVK